MRTRTITLLAALTLVVGFSATRPPGRWRPHPPAPRSRSRSKAKPVEARPPGRGPASATSSQTGASRRSPRSRVAS